jgi:TonB family protein
VTRAGRLACTATLVGLGACAAPEKSTPPPAMPPIPGMRDVPIGGARADAFARYVVDMHRRIHEPFTHGFLRAAAERHDARLADETLWTQLRIVVRPDGTLRAVTVLRPSGVPEFDAGATSSVARAAPFPPTPPDIRSVDGNVYVDWQFHRDERGCDVIGVDPHILIKDQPPASEKALE